MSINDLKRAYLCLRFIEANFKVGGAPETLTSAAAITGYKPGLEDGMDFIWAEGSLSVALGHKRNSRNVIRSNKAISVVDKKVAKWVQALFIKVGMEEIINNILDPEGARYKLTVVFDAPLGSLPVLKIDGENAEVY